MKDIDHYIELISSFRLALPDVVLLFRQFQFLIDATSVSTLTTGRRFCQILQCVVVQYLSASVVNEEDSKCLPLLCHFPWDLSLECTCASR